MSEPLKIQAVTKWFGNLVAVDELDLTVPSGAVIGLVGPNGCGKTTTLSMACGLLPPDRGSVSVVGVPAGSPTARHCVGLVPDQPTGLDNLTITEYLELYRRLCHLRPDRFSTAASALVDAFGLAPRLGSRLGELSTGMRRQVSIIAVAARRPDLVVVDEATATLDPEAVIILRSLLRRLADLGCGVLVATQDLHFAQSACDEVTMLVRGRVAAVGSPANLLAAKGATDLEGVFVSVLDNPGFRAEVRHALAEI